MEARPPQKWFAAIGRPRGPEHRATSPDRPTSPDIVARCRAISVISGP